MRLVNFLLLAAFPGSSIAEVIELPALPKEGNIGTAPGEIDPGAECFSIDIKIDPVVAEGGEAQVVAGLAIGLPEEAASRTKSQLRVELREGGGRTLFALWHGNTHDLAAKPPHPKTPGWVDTREYQHSNELAMRDGEGHHFRLVVWPEGAGSRVRLFIDAMDRPKQEHLLEERITAGFTGFFSLHTGSGEPKLNSRFSHFAFEKISAKEAMRLPTARETVLATIDPDYPPMAPVVGAMEKGDTGRAQELFLEHMCTRGHPPGPNLDKIPNTVLHPDWQTIADMALDGQYGTVGYFTGFTRAWRDTNGDTHTWVLRDEPRQLRWSRCNGHLNRHFHWVSLARAWRENGDGRYAKLFSDEVFDWVNREPFFWDNTPLIGGLNLMDGTSFRWGYMNTSNIGRRLELTWWPAYETFRKAPEFSDESHFAMLLGMIRQAELITNPSSFAVHDDGAAHSTMALLKTAMMLPEFKASARWKAMAEERWDEMLARQFHPDGSHVSLSTGYNWATILALENFVRLIEQFGGKAPGKYLNILAKAAEHPMLLTRPQPGANRSQRRRLEHDRGSLSVTAGVVSGSPRLSVDGEQGRQRFTPGTQVNLLSQRRPLRDAHRMGAGRKVSVFRRGPVGRQSRQTGRAECIRATWKSPAHPQRRARQLQRSRQHRSCRAIPVFQYTVPRLGTGKQHPALETGNAPRIRSAQTTLGEQRAIRLRRGHL